MSSRMTAARQSPATISTPSRYISASSTFPAGSTKRTSASSTRIGTPGSASRIRRHARRSSLTHSSLSVPSNRSVQVARPPGVTCKVSVMRSIGFRPSQPPCRGGDGPMAAARSPVTSVLVPNTSARLPTSASQSQDGLQLSRLAGAARCLRRRLSNRRSEYPQEGGASMSELKGKVAVVTGASKGIGAGIAKELAAAGAAVVVNYVSSKAGAERVVAEIAETGGTAIAVQGDVSKSSDVRRPFAGTKKAVRRLDVLVNNAGVYHFQPVEEGTEAEYRWHFDTNVLGPLLATQEAVKHFGPSGGTVINIGSIASTKPAAALVVYSATKGALDTMTRVLAVELAPKNIRVNSVNPGYVLTEGSEAIGLDAASDAAKQMVARTALGRPGRPDDIARTVAFLASDQSGWLTGERIEASGGYA